MRIVWINESADFEGGAEGYVARTATSLAKSGCTSILLHRAGTWVGPDFAESFSACFPVVDLRAQLEDLKPDIVYLHQFYDRTLWSELLGLAESLSFPLVHFVHDHRLFCLRNHKYTALSEKTCTKTVARIACYPCLGFVERTRAVGALSPIRIRTVSSIRRDQALIRKFDAIVVGSNYMRAHVCAHGFPAGRVHHVPLGIRQPNEAKAERSRDVDRLLFVGALLRGKGLDILLTALAGLPNRVRLDVVGEGAQRDAICAQITELGLDARVTLLGKLNAEKLSEKYRSVAAVVVPSRAPETFGFVGPEALLHGTPVIASPIGGTTEWLKPGETAFSFEACDAMSLKRTLENVLADPEAALNIARAGGEHCRKLFSEVGHVVALKQLFSKLGEATGAV